MYIYSFRATIDDCIKEHFYRKGIKITYHSIHKEKCIFRKRMKVKCVNLGKCESTTNNKTFCAIVYRSVYV